MNEHEMHKRDNCLELGPDDDAAYLGEYCFASDGIHMCKGKRLMVGTLPVNNGPSYVMIAISRGTSGLHIPYTAHAARELAASSTSPHG